MPTPLRVKVELELTPRWWKRLTNRLTNKSVEGERYDEVRALHARAVEVAFGLGYGVQLLKTKRRAFVARLAIPSDTSLVVLCERAGQVIEELNALDVSCLGEPEPRAKYL